MKVNLCPLPPPPLPPVPKSILANDVAMFELRLGDEGQWTAPSSMAPSLGRPVGNPPAWVPSSLLHSRTSPASIADDPRDAT